VVLKATFISMLAILLAGCNPHVPERFVDVDGTLFQIYEKGTGHPTVIFESGMASGIDSWNSIPDSISRITTVFAYNRAGIGQSEATENERTIPNMVSELRLLLKKEKINPPYIYVAHSMGSYLARYFAVHYPVEVAGILLIDPSPDKMYDEYTDEEYREFQAIGNKSFANSSEGEVKEWENYLDNRKFVQNKPIPDDIPLIIVSATEWDFYDYHEAMMNSNLFSRHMSVEGGHGLHGEQPKLVIDLINELIKQAGK
jgi:pimeloyl-ACP methyl ester carboxylesterase